MRGSWILLLGWLAAAPLHAQQPRTSVPAPTSPAASRTTIDKYCVSCHNDRRRTADLTLEQLDLDNVGPDAAVWEKVVRKLRLGAMPPAGLPRPDRPGMQALAHALESDLDQAAQRAPNPGRPAAFHRLNRAEYKNAIRDLLALDIDVAAMLPPDAASYGFDNIGDVLGMSPFLLERYLAAARKISRLAVGNPAIVPGTETYRVPSDLTQDAHLDGLPWGTRGGALVQHHFPLDGEYVLKVRLARESVNDVISGLTEPHPLEVTLDGDHVQTVTVGAELATRKKANLTGTRVLYGDEYLRTADDRLEVRFSARAGTRGVGVTFVQRSDAEIESVRQPFLRAAPENGDSHGQPYISSFTIAGPFNAAGAAASASRARVFSCRPAKADDDAACARTILTTLARRAYRRPLASGDVDDLLHFFQTGRRQHGFDAGVELALARMLVSPAFLFRVEDDPPNAAPGTPYPVGDWALASRLSFFLWSSIPDDRLLDLAERGQLSEPAVLDAEVRRMLADDKAAALVTNFAGQWLYLRNVSAMLPDRRLFPDFDDNLRRAFRQETELFVQEIIREDASVLDFLTANYTFVNERLARHYGIPGVYGDRFRRITLPMARAAACSDRAASSPSAPIRTAPRRCCAACGCSRTSSARRHRRRRPTSPTCRKRTPTARCSRCGSGWRSTGRTRHAAPAIRAWTRSAWPWKTSTRSAPGGRAASRKGPLTRPAPCPTGPSSTASPACAERCCSTPTSSSPPCRRSCWSMRSDAAPNPTTHRPSGASSATRRVATTASRR